MDAWKGIIRDQMKPELPDVNSGDTVDVHYRVVEGDKERTQVFSGTVIRLRGSDTGATITVRKVASGGVGVERIFPMHSPFIADIKVRKHGFVRRAKLYYLRERRGKSARLKEKSTVG